MFYQVGLLDQPDVQAEISSFTVSPERVFSGQSATLTWRVENASSVDLQPGVGKVALEGARSVRPASTTTYTLLASNDAGTTSAECTLQIAAGSVTVPSVLGMDKAAARETVENANLIAVIEGDEAEAADAVVLNQDPAATEEVERGSEVTLTLGPRTIQTPDPVRNAAEEVEAIYVQHRTTESCVGIRRLCARLETFFENADLAPSNVARSVTYPPNRTGRPTIGDLARDRWIRIQRARADCFRRPSDRPAVNQEAADDVQAIYVRLRTTESCAGIRRLCARLETFFENTDLVPRDLARTVRDPPNRREPPTIGDLARDRRTRIQQARSDCFR